MLNNSIVLLISDNGGATEDSKGRFQNFASNWPLRGVRCFHNEYHDSLVVFFYLSNVEFLVSIIRLDEKFSNRRRSSRCSSFMEPVDKITKLHFQYISAFNRLASYILYSRW